MPYAYEVPLHRPPVGNAAADLSGKQFYCVKMTSSGVNLSGDTEAILGVLQNKPESGKPCEVETLGTTRAVAGAAITKGANIASGTGGKIRAATTGDYISGIALEAAAADGDIIPITLRPLGKI